MTFPGTACRTLVVAGAAAAALASGSSNSNRPDTAASYGTYAAPAPQPMDPHAALGLWKSSFGPVKIERDPAGGPNQVSGVWVYDRSGEVVVGYFTGPLDGNVLQFRWHEPGEPDLVGEGYLVFDQTSRTFNGRWWTSQRDRGGDWQGWRQEAGPDDGSAPPPAPDGSWPPRDDGMPHPGGAQPPDGPAEEAPPPGEPAPGETI
ncbi:MAG TPA: hypothetical protein VKZ63_03465 [Kofleriaceae bacterium]|nr:hypothetical protein [Kofleriaceae bacterium]